MSAYGKAVAAKWARKAEIDQKGAPNSLQPDAALEKPPECFRQHHAGQDLATRVGETAEAGQQGEAARAAQWSAAEEAVEVATSLGGGGSRGGDASSKEECESLRHTEGGAVAQDWWDAPVPGSGGAPKASDGDLHRVSQAAEVDRTCVLACR